MMFTFLSVFPFMLVLEKQHEREVFLKHAACGPVCESKRVGVPVRNASGWQAAFGHLLPPQPQPASGTPPPSFYQQEL